MVFNSQTIPGDASPPSPPRKKPGRVTADGACSLQHCNIPGSQYGDKSQLVKFDYQVLGVIQMAVSVLGVHG